MAFSFGFTGDDIDIDEAEIDQQDQSQGNVISAVDEDDTSIAKLVEARRHEIGEWLPTLPSQISYNKLHLSCSNPSNPEEGKSKQNGKDITLARREVFDIRTQLMAEDNDGGEQTNDELISGLDEGDIKPNFYEGGFKTWECALDLAKWIVDYDRQSENGELRVIELGAGTAIPSLSLFAELLTQSGSSSRRTHFIFADYNAVVLRLVTLPNLLLTWNYLVNQQRQNQNQEEGEEEEEELDITLELLDTFQQDLANRDITIDFISGAWSPAFVDLTFSSAANKTANGKGNSQTLILASETIYSPSSLGAFSETLLSLLRWSAGTEGSKTRALVAAKKVYFGVGGGVDEFLAVLRDIGSSEIEVKQVADLKSEGVGRVVLEIVPAEKR